ncbi:MAG TPA: YtxH domain-containing protein [Candidatus Dormibacteraeota bacterium]
MKRLAIGAALGGFAAYLFDPKLGAERRERLISMWQDNRDTAVQAGQTASRALESARPVARRVTKAVGRGDWAQVFEPRHRSASVPKLIGAAAVGGALIYFLDPVRGSERRRSMIVTGRRAVDKIVKAAKTVPGHVGGSPADSEDRTKSRVG